MSFLKNFCREKIWNAYGRTNFGTCKKAIYPNEKDKDKFYSATLIYLDSGKEVLINYENKKNTNCYKAINNLLYKLAQAQLQDDFVESDIFHNRISSFLEQRDSIYNALTQFEGKTQQEINDWFRDEKNQQLLSDFLICLNNIYECRTTFAKFKDFCWELADALVIALIAVGVAAIVIKLAGIGIFGAAFSPLIKSVPLATELEGAGTLAIAVRGLQNSWYNFFKSEEEKPIKKAIKQDLQQNARLMNL